MAVERFSYINTIPSLVNAENLIPTRRVNNAEINAICSLPSPLAIDKATSVPIIIEIFK